MSQKHLLVLNQQEEGNEHWQFGPLIYQTDTDLSAPSDECPRTCTATQSFNEGKRLEGKRSKVWKSVQPFLKLKWAHTVPATCSPAERVKPTLRIHPYLLVRTAGFWERKEMSTSGSLRAAAWATSSRATHKQRLPSQLRPLWWQVQVPLIWKNLLESPSSSWPCQPLQLSSTLLSLLLWNLGQTHMLPSQGPWWNDSQSVCFLS